MVTVDDYNYMHKEIKTGPAAYSAIWGLVIFETDRKEVICRLRRQQRISFIILE